MQVRRISTLPAVCIVALIYFAAGKFGLTFASLHQSASPVWPPAGIALASLLLLGNRIWPGIFAAAFLVNLLTAGNIATSLGIATGNTLEAFCGAWLVNRFAGGIEAFDNAANVFKFSVAAAISTLVSPTIGITSLALGGFASWSNFSPVWLTWWQGDLTGDLIIAPLIVLWCSDSVRKWTRSEIAEVSALFLALIVLAEISFGGWFPISAKNYPISFLYGPFVVWLAFRFTPREAATGIFVLVSFAIWGTLQGRGPFVLQTENQSLLILQMRTAILAITALALAAAMTQRRRFESALQEQKAIVEAANRTKDNFLAMLSHELRTPLTPVITAVDTLETGPLSTDESNRALAMIRRNVELESQLIDDLLDLTRIAKDKLQLQFDPVDVHCAVHNVIEICRPEADAKNIRIHANLRAGAHTVCADAAKLQQIVWNLLKNAIKFTPENGEIAISSFNPASGILNITVRDSGVGIEPDLMKRIFDPFEQGNRSVERGFGGLGLGLAISKSLAQAHGGTLTARSEGRNQGSTFTLAMETISPPQNLIPREAKPTSSPRHGLRILLVDDHHDTCEALEKLLIRRGHLVAATHNVRTAMEAAVRNQFDLLISDISLPDGTGIDLFMQLRAISQMPALAISGFGNNGDIEKSLQAGFSQHLVKPVKLEKLEAAIERALEGAAVS